MKNFFKIFFIACMFFISLSTVAFGAQKNLDVIRPISNQEVFISGCLQESFVVSSNSQNSEVYLQNDNKENYIGGNLFKASAQARFLSQIFAQNYNKTYLSKSHKISPILKNEICTRAP